jgi:hypothetical protein
MLSWRGQRHFRLYTVGLHGFQMWRGVILICAFCVLLLELWARCFGSIQGVDVRRSDLPSSVSSQMSTTNIYESWATDELRLPLYISTFRQTDTTKSTPTNYKALHYVVFPLPCYFFPCKFIYSTQHSFLKFPQYGFLRVDDSRFSDPYKREGKITDLCLHRYSPPNTHTG